MHHAATGHMTREQVFVPPSRKNLPWFLKKWKKSTVTINGIELEEFLEDAPLFRLGLLVFQQVSSKITRESSTDIVFSY